jgi:glycosyltransferase involved in cell wall biosynthesis
MNKLVFLIRNTVGFGGGEVYQLKLAEKLKEVGYEPVVVTNSAELLRRAKKDGYKTLIPPYISRQNWSGVYNFLLPIYFAKIRKLRKWYERMFEKYTPEVVNIQSRDDFIAATLAAKKCGVKILWTDHADFRNWVLWNVNVPFKNVIGKKIIKLSRLAEKVIFVSQNVKDETREMIHPLKIEHATVMLNGARDKFNSYKNIEPKKMSFVFVGRLTEEKGVGELTEAFRIVRKQYPEAVLNIYGDGNINKYRRMAGEGTVFHDATDEPLRVIAENDIFVLPSYREGLSLSLLDAAMMQKKIIASDVDGNPEVVEDGVSGLLVPAKNAEKLAEAMIWLLESPKEANEMAKVARKKYESEFNFDKIFAEKMLPLYNNKKECK